MGHASTRDEGGGRARSGHHPRDPAVAASKDPTASLRLPAEADVPVAGEAAEPEGMSPEEAACRRALKRSSEVQVGSGPDSIDAAGASGSSAARPLAIANEPADVPAADGGLAAPNAADAEAIVPVADQPTWSRFGLRTSLQLLRSVRPGVVRRCLRKLHIRWYHAPSKRMTTLLTAAGVPVDVLSQIPGVVATCGVCRARQRPGNRFVVSTKLPERFNRQVELDLLFVGTHVILHMIDRCIR